MMVQVKNIETKNHKISSDSRISTSDASSRLAEKIIAGKRENQLFGIEL